MLRAAKGDYLFLNVKRGNDALIELHDHLYTGVLRPYRALAHTFTPHLTVGRVGSPEALREALNVAAQTDIAIDTIVSALSIYCVESDGVRPIESEVPFG